MIENITLSRGGHGAASRENAGHSCIFQPKIRGNIVIIR
jgi:hypothetical protein